MIETYEILSGKYDMVAVPNQITSTILTTRGNDLRLQQDAQLSQRDRAAGCVSFGQKWKTGGLSLTTVT